MANSQLLSDLQTLIIPGFSFIVGLLVKSRFQWGKANSQVLDTVSKDYEVMKKLYDAKCDEVDRLKETVNSQNELIRETRARVTSYENFLQTRTIETDKLLKKVPYLMDAVAKHLGIEIPEQAMNGHEAAHSQVKSDGSSNT